MSFSTKHHTSGGHTPAKPASSNKRRLLPLIFMFGVVLILMIASVLFFSWYQKKKASEAIPIIAITEVIRWTPYEFPTSGEADLLDMKPEEVPKPPETDLATLEQPEQFATLEHCEILPDTGTVQVKIRAKTVAKSDDEFYYLMAMNTYHRSLPADADIIDKVPKQKVVKLHAALNYDSPSSRLFQKFVVTVKQEGSFVPITTASYITNPEAIAKYSSVYMTPASKKGLLADPNKLRGNELDDLGVKQAAYNIPVARILGPSTSAHYPTIHYSYNGRSYQFNGQVIAEYDLVFSILTSKGITVTAIILNNCSGAYQHLTHPDARSGSTAPYYMFNGEEDAGVEHMAAIGTFLANRYSDKTHGRISNWIIANEINARKEWNYMKHTDLTTYVAAYERAFRVFYTAIKSVSSSARIYMPIDQQWDRNLKNNPNYDGRDVIDTFNRLICEKGNIDWHLSQHPYNVPLTNPCVWNPSKYVKRSVSTSMITMQNIEILINYMKQDYLQTKDGKTRGILLSEQGYTSQGGEANQAASFAYAYYKAEHYSEIDGFLLNRQTDAPSEVAQGLSFGLNHVNGTGRKQIYNVFKYIDTAEHAAYTDFAKEMIGISSWGEIMH